MEILTINLFNTETYINYKFPYWQDSLSHKVIKFYLNKVHISCPLYTWEFLIFILNFIIFLLLSYRYLILIQVDKQREKEVISCDILDLNYIPQFFHVLPFTRIKAFLKDACNSKGREKEYILYKCKYMNFLFKCSYYERSKYLSCWI